MSDDIVPWRPRDKVARRIESGATTAVNERMPVWIIGNVGTMRLLRALATEGLTMRLDLPSNCVVIEEAKTGVLSSHP